MAINNDGTLYRPDRDLEGDYSTTTHKENVQFYTMNVRKQRQFKKKLITETIYEVRFSEEWTGEKLINVKQQLHEMFEKSIKEATSGANMDTDFGRIFISHEKLSPPIIIKPQPLNQLTAETVMQEIERVLHSEESLDINSTFEVHISKILIPSGSGGGIKIRNVSGPGNDLYKKRSIVTIPANNELNCLARSIVVCLARLEDPGSYNKVRDHRGNEQKKRALELHRLAGVRNDKPASFMDLPKFEHIIRRRIIVYSATTGNSSPIYQGTPYPGKSPIFLYHTAPVASGEMHPGHFDAVTSITGCLNSSFFCVTCLKPYDDKKKHFCETYCQMCWTHNCPSLLEPSGNLLSFVCTQCNRTFNDKECLDRHTQTKHGSTPKSACKLLWKCPSCKTTMKEQTELTLALSGGAQTAKIL